MGHSANGTHRVGGWVGHSTNGTHPVGGWVGHSANGTHQVGGWVGRSAFRVDENLSSLIISTSQFFICVLQVGLTSAGVVTFVVLVVAHIIRHKS